MKTQIKIKYSTVSKASQCYRVFTNDGKKEFPRKTKIISNGEIVGYTIWTVTE